MSKETCSFVTTPRQYRPTYSYLPSSIAKSNFGSSVSQATTAQPAPVQHRRRTTSNFTSAERLHSAPTVASSGLTASVLSNDISHPTPKAHRLSLQPRTLTPTRIPTPTCVNKASLLKVPTTSPAAELKQKEVHSKSIAFNPVY
jgi:hypothetical protein